MKSGLYKKSTIRNGKEKDMGYLLEKQHAKKKYHAVERISLLVDPGSFREIGSGIENFGSEFGDSEKVVYDGVITGRGTVKGKQVYIFAQDFTVKGGTIGKAHGEKIANLIRMAIENRCPVIGIYDSGGARIEEGIHALKGCGEIMYYNSLASGVIPQISIIAGPCAGAAAYSPALTDFVFIIDRIGYMFVTGAGVVTSVTGEKCDNQKLGGAKVHAEKSGVADFLEPDEKKCFKHVKRLIQMLPSEPNMVKKRDTEGYKEKSQEKKFDIIPRNSHKPYDIRKIIEIMADENGFLEIGSDFAKSIVTGFMQISGMTIGVIANQPAYNGGALDCDSSDKAARMVRFCDSFKIPVLTLVDTPGYLPGIDEEHNGIIRHGAKLIYAYSEATVPQITVILRKAYGGAYIAMGSKHLHVDYVYALKTAEIAVMGAEGAVSVLNRKKMEQLQDEESKKVYTARKLEKYKEKYMNPFTAIRSGYVDEIIRPEEIRQRVFEDFQALRNKRQNLPEKKHGNIPL